jgi:HEAT repeat protein
MKTSVLTVLAFSFSLCWWSACRAAEDDIPIAQGRSLNEWIADLKDPDHDVRYEAARVLAHLGPRAQPALPVIKELLKQGDPKLWHPLYEALGRMGAAGLPVMLEQLEADQSGSFEMTAIQYLGPDALPELIKALEQGNVRRRRVVERDWGRIGFAGQKSSPR